MRRLLLVLLVVGASGLVACGGDAASDKSVASSASASTAPSSTVMSHESIVKDFQDLTGCELEFVNDDGDALKGSEETIPMVLYDTTPCGPPGLVRVYESKEDAIAIVADLDLELSFGALVNRVGEPCWSEYERIDYVIVSVAVCEDAPSDLADITQPMRVVIPG